MPVVLITAPPLPAPVEAQSLRAVAGRVADALGLGPGDVVVAAVHAARTVAGDAEVPGWPVIVLHGSPRDPGALRTAELAARDQVALSWSVPIDRVWSQWLIRPAD